MASFEKLTMDMEMFKEARRQTLLSAAKQISELKQQLKEKEAMTTSETKGESEEIIRLLREKLAEQDKNVEYPYKTLFYVQLLLWIVVVIVLIALVGDFKVDDGRQFS